MNRVSFGGPVQQETSVKPNNESSVKLNYRSAHSFKESRNNSHNQDEIDFILGSKDEDRSSLIGS